MSESFSTLIDLFDTSEFRLGALLGVVGLVALSAIPRSLGWKRPWGVAAAGAVLVGVHVVEGQRLGLFVGIATMAVGGVITGSSGSVGGIPIVRVTGWCVAAIGAALISWHGQIESDSWFFVATPIVALALAVLFAAWIDSPSLMYLGPITAITSFAIWTTVPDTELARLTLGLMLPLALCTLPPILASLTRAGSFALAGVLAWLPLPGGEPRPASVIGSWASVGVIALLPVAERLWPRRSLRPVALLVLHSSIAFIAARVIGLWTRALPAVLATCVLYALGLVVSYLLGKRRPVADIKVHA